MVLFFPGPAILCYPQQWVFFVFFFLFFWQGLVNFWPHKIKWNIVSQMDPFFNNKLSSQIFKWKLLAGGGRVGFHHISTHFLVLGAIFCLFWRWSFFFLPLHFQKFSTDFCLIDAKSCLGWLPIMLHEGGKN
jgi:hypothetical protein